MGTVCMTITVGITEVLCYPLSSSSLPPITNLHNRHALPTFTLLFQEHHIGVEEGEEIAYKLLCNVIFSDWHSLFGVLYMKSLQVAMAVGCRAKPIAFLLAVPKMEQPSAC